MANPRLFLLLLLCTLIPLLSQQSVSAQWANPPAPTTTPVEDAAPAVDPSGPAVDPALSTGDPAAAAATAAASPAAPAAAAGPYHVFLPAMQAVRASGSLMLGAYVDGQPAPATITAFQQLVGRSLDINGMYATWDMRFNDWDRLQHSCEQGQIPLITWEPQGDDGSNRYPLAEIAAGKFDEQLRRDLSALQASTCPKIIVRFAHEMNTRTVRWYNWQAQPEAYVAAWQHVVTLAHEIAPKIAWCWAPQQPNDVKLYGFAEFYPGDAYVDYVGTTITNFVTDDPSWPYKTSWTLFSTRWKNEYPYYRSVNKPIIISETATTESLTNPNGKAEWIHDLFATVRSYRDVVGVVWFHRDAARGHYASSYRVDTSDAALQAFREELRIP
jgi:hypothetical protein